MSHSIPTPENLKEKAKVLRKVLKEKHGSDISHSHCMEMISQIFGFKDWNTASASLKPNVDTKIYPMKIGTVSDLKKALAPYDDSASVHADYEFRLGDFLDGIDPMEEPDYVRLQEFSMKMESFGDDLAIFKLVLEDESTGTDGVQFSLGIGLK